MDIVGTSIVSFNNGECGKQPAILLQDENGKRYLVVSTPERKFQITETDLRKV